MSVDRIRKVSDSNELENVVDDYVTLGYKVNSRGQNTVKLKERNGWGTIGGHIGWFLLTFWWTVGIGNLIYALVKHYNGETVLVKVEEG